MRQIKTCKTHTEKCSREGTYELMKRSKLDTSILHRKPYHMTCEKEKEKSNDDGAMEESI